VKTTVGREVRNIAASLAPPSSKSLASIGDHLAGADRHKSITANHEPVTDRTRVIVLDFGQRKNGEKYEKVCLSLFRRKSAEVCGRR
jgi:hypothetical protein